MEKKKKRNRILKCHFRQVSTKQGVTVSENTVFQQKPTKANVLYYRRKSIVLWLRKAFN